MARKIRFFKDQMSKAGVVAKAMLGKESDIDLDDVEVIWGYMLFNFHFMPFSFLTKITLHLSGLLGKAWGARS